MSTISEIWIYQCDVCEFTVVNDESIMISHVMALHVNMIRKEEEG